MDNGVWIIFILKQKALKLKKLKLQHTNFINK